MKIKFCNLRLRCGRNGIEFYPLPTIQCILNEYGEKYQPNWQLRFLWIWFCINVSSKNYGKGHK